MAVASPTFTGFRPEAIQFLADLAENNERAWFQPRKADYERLLKEPLEALVAATGERFAARGIPLRADPARGPFRIYRDVRFSKDKSPYKTNIGASFPWAEGDGHRHGGGYFHLQPAEIYVGGGVWRPEKPWLDAFRRRILDDPRGIRAALEEKTFRETFGSIGGGEKLTRVPSGFPPDHPEAELFKLKDVTFGRRLSDAEAMSARLPDLIADTFATALPLMRILAAVG